MKALLQRYGFGLGLVFLYLYSFPYFTEIRSANELPRVYLTRAMVEEGTFAIDTGVARWGTTVDVSPSGGHMYSNKAPGSSFLAVPAYLVLKAASGWSEPSLAAMTWTCRVFTGVVPTLLFLWLLWHFLARFAPRPETRRLVLVAYALGSMAMTYSVLFIAHQLSAVCIGTAWVLIVRWAEDDLDQRWLLAAGAAAGAAPLVDYQAAFVGVPVAAYLLWQAIRCRRWQPVALAAAGAAPPIALLLYYHAVAFGGPFTTGYAASETFAHFHQQGFLGMTELRWEAFAGSMAAPDNGLILFSPWLLLALPGWWLLARERRYAHVAVTLAAVLVMILFLSSINFWRGGWQMGPRYITAMLPFALVPVTVALAAAEGRWPRRGIAVGLVLVGVVVYALSCAQYPHFPEKFRNPLYEVTFRLIADGHAPYNAGWLLGLRGFASLVPYLIVLAAVAGWAALPDRRAWRSAALGVALAVAIIAAYGAFEGGGPVADEAYQRSVAGAMP